MNKLHFKKGIILLISISALISGCGNKNKTNDNNLGDNNGTVAVKEIEITESDETKQDEYMSIDFIEGATFDVRSCDIAGYLYNSEEKVDMTTSPVIYNNLNGFRLIGLQQFVYTYDYDMDIPDISIVNDADSFESLLSDVYMNHIYNTFKVDALDNFKIVDKGSYKQYEAEIWFKTTPKYTNEDLESAAYHGFVIITEQDGKNNGFFFGCTFEAFSIDDYKHIKDSFALCDNHFYALDTEMEEKNFVFEDVSFSGSFPKFLNLRTFDKEKDSESKPKCYSGKNIFYSEHIDITVEKYFNYDDIDLYIDNKILDKFSFIGKNTINDIDGRVWDKNSFESDMYISTLYTTMVGDTLVSVEFAAPNHKSFDNQRELVDEGIKSLYINENPGYEFLDLD